MCIHYEKSSSFTIDDCGRPVVELMTLKDFSMRCSPAAMQIILDTGASVTTLNKQTADENGYTIIEKEATVLFGFNDRGIITRELKRLGVTNLQSLLSSYTPKELKDYLVKNGITDVGLLYDLRIIPIVVFGGYQIKDVIVSTPTEDNTYISEVLGMNVLGRFHFGLDFEHRRLHLAKNANLNSALNPKYFCGDILYAQDSIQLLGQTTQEVSKNSVSVDLQLDALLFNTQNSQDKTVQQGMCMQIILRYMYITGEIVYNMDKKQYKFSHDMCLGDIETALQTLLRDGYIEQPSDDRYVLTDRGRSAAH